MAKRQANLRKLAQRQRWIIWLVALSLVGQFLPMLTQNYLVGHSQFILMMGVSLLMIVVYLAMIVGAVLVLHAQGNHILIIILSGIVMLAPCGNLLLLVLINMSVTRTLRRAGIRVGFMGANLADVERAINPLLCRGCGYNLVGNVSGYCPECGRPIDRLIPHVGNGQPETT
jgi:hypothetical protein